MIVIVNNRSLAVYSSWWIKGRSKVYQVEINEGHVTKLGGHVTKVKRHVITVICHAVLRSPRVPH